MDTMPIVQRMKYSGSLSVRRIENPCRYRMGSAATSPNRLRKNAISKGWSSAEARRIGTAMAPNRRALVSM